jgi:hypothetical protein
MNATKVEATVQTDGELLLTHLPVRKGDRVEAIILSLGSAAISDLQESDTAKEKRQEAWGRFEARANASRFHSQGPYPTRDELHERY